MGPKIYKMTSAVPEHTFLPYYPIEKLQGKAKGMMIILIKHGLWPKSDKLLARCAGGCK